jgi:hypothetical protein
VTALYEGGDMRFPSLLLRIGVFFGIHAGLLVGILTLF